jgi:hypothetical protein
MKNVTFAVTNEITTALMKTGMVIMRAIAV